METVSVVMPTLNQGAFIEQAIQSVLRQAGERCELIVRDAVSTDETPAILSRYGDRIRWVREPDGGQADAINRGFADATGGILCWLNSDDGYLPGALQRVREAFAQDAGLAFVYGDALEIDAAGRILTPNLYTEECDRDRYLNSHNFICQPTFFFRRTALARVGPLRELRWVLDYEWFGRFFALGLRGRRLPFFLAANRVHPGTKTNTGGGARLREIRDILAARPGGLFAKRKAYAVYHLEWAVKALEQYAATRRSPASLGPLAERLGARLATLFLDTVAPRSRADILARFREQIAPRGDSLEELWQDAANGAADASRRN